jgi:hypothetical protein
MAMSAPVGRGLVIGATVLGVVIVGGLITLLLPRSGTQVNAGPAVPLATASSLRFDTGPTTVPAPTSVPTTAVTATTAVSPPTAAPSVSAVGASPQPPTTILVNATGAAGIGWADGSMALTSSAGLGGADVMQIVLPDGSLGDALVTSVDEVAGLAVLSLPVPLEVPERLGTPVTGMKVATEPNQARLSRLVARDDGVMSIEADETPRTGAPVVATNGSVVGLCGRDATGWYVIALPEPGWVPPPGATDPSAPDTTAPATTIQPEAPTLPGSQLDPEAPVASPADPSSSEAPEAPAESLPPDEQAWLGVQVVVDGDGARILYIRDDSPAEAAGFETDDVLVTLDGVTIDSRAALSETIGANRPGDIVKAVVERGGARLELDVVFGVKPPEM